MILRRAAAGLCLVLAICGAGPGQLTRNIDSSLPRDATPPPPPPPPNVVFEDDTGNSIIYSSINSAVGSSWGHVTDTQDKLSTEHFNNYCSKPIENVPIQGAMAVETFDGTQIQLLGKKGSVLGIGAWAIDGGALHTFNAFDTQVAVYQQILATSPTLSQGSHVITWQVTCNSSGSGTYQVVDGYYITNGNALPTSSATQASFTTSGVTHTGTWSTGPDSKDLSGSHVWSGVTGNSISWTFSGTLIEVFGRPDVGDGLFTVTIDNVVVATVDGHYGQVDNDALTAYMLYAHKMSGAGPHVIKLTVTGTDGPVSGAESGSGLKHLLQFDRFYAYP